MFVSIRADAIIYNLKDGLRLLLLCKLLFLNIRSLLLLMRLRKIVFVDFYFMSKSEYWVFFEFFFDSVENLIVCNYQEASIHVTIADALITGSDSR